MADPVSPIGRIKNDYVRRAALLAMFPVLVVWHFNWRLVAFPLAVLWNAIEAAGRGAFESVSDDLTTRPMRLLVAAWRRIWSAPVGENDNG